MTPRGESTWAQRHVGWDKIAKRATAHHLFVAERPKGHIRTIQRAGWRSSGTMPTTIGQLAKLRGPIGQVAITAGMWFIAAMGSCFDAGTDLMGTAKLPISMDVALIPDLPRIGRSAR